MLALGIFVGYSKVPDYVADAVHLKRIGQESLGVADAEDEPDAAAGTAEAEPLDTARQRILLFGDSMSQLIALRLSDYANQNGHSLTCVTWNGSGTQKWASTDTLDHYMRSVKPTQVFVCLGSNELYTSDLKNCRRRAEQILAKIGSVPTIWIGPPNWTGDYGINTTLQQLLGKRRFFMTKGMKLKRQPDGRHPTISGGVIWTDSIVSWINHGKAVHPFRLDKPLKRCAKYRQIFIGQNGARRADRAAADSLRHVEAAPVVEAPDEASAAPHPAEKELRGVRPAESDAHPKPAESDVRTKEPAQE